MKMRATAFEKQIIKNFVELNFNNNNIILVMIKESFNLLNVRHKLIFIILSFELLLINFFLFFFQIPPSQFFEKSAWLAREILKNQKQIMILVNCHKNNDYQ